LLLAAIALLTGCSKDDRYEVLSAKEETRKGETDHIVTVFTLKHGRTIITASCQQYVNNVEMKCAELVVGDSYALKRYRGGSMDMLVLQFPEKKGGSEKKSGGAVLDVEAETVRQ
jgi:hypothetical protein